MRSMTSYRAQLGRACEIGKSDSETLYAPDLGGLAWKYGLLKI